MIKPFVRVLRDTRFEVDLLTGDHVNVWEPQDRPFTGKLVPMDWEDLEPYFDVEIVPPEVLQRQQQAKQAYINACMEAGLPSGLEQPDHPHYPGVDY